MTQKVPHQELRILRRFIIKQSLGDLY